MQNRLTLLYVISSTTLQIAAKKSRERKINNLKDLRKQRESLMRETRELQNIAVKYQQKKEELTQKKQIILRKLALMRRK